MPEPIFLDLLRPLDSGIATGFEWLDEEKTALAPTSETKSYKMYKYTFGRPTSLDRIWRLHTLEEPQGKKDKRGQLVPFRRGHGCARLHLSAAAAQRGERTDLLAQVTGNTTVSMKVPSLQRAMPTLTMKVSVATMDKQGHILWPTTYSAKTAAALRKQMRHHLQEMIDNPEYPTLSHMSPALTCSSEAQLLLTAQPARAPQSSLRLCQSLV